MTIPIVNPLIAKLERRDRLSEEERQALHDMRATPRRFLTGQDLVREGERPTESTLLLSGFCARYVSLADGRRQITALHVAGDFVDLPSLLLHVMDHGVVALSECSVLAVAHESLLAITERFPHLTRLLWLSTLIDFSVNGRWLVAMGRLAAAARLAHLLCELVTRLEIVGLVRDESFELPLTQSELADVLGLSAVHVNRTVQTLRQEGLIAWPGRTITILDRARLAEYGEFDPSYLHLEREAR